MAAELESSRRLLHALKQVPAKQRQLETQLTRKLQRLFSQTMRDVMRLMNEEQVTPSSDLQYKKILMPFEELRTSILPILDEGAEAAGQYGQNQVLRLHPKKKKALKAISPRIVQLLRAKTFEASQSTMSRMIGDVMNNLSLSAEQGLGIRVAATNLKGVLQSMNDYELLRVARTEIISSQNLSIARTEQELGIEYHQWWTAEDERVRDTAEASHVDMHGQIVRVGDRFSNGLEYPGDRSGNIEEWINCRCRPVPFLMSEGKKAPSGRVHFYEGELVDL